MKLHITIITVFPELHTSFLETSLLKRAREAGILSVSTIKFSDCVAPKERIDAPMVGHAAGMVLRAEVLERAMEKAVAAHGEGIAVFFAPDGQLLSQPIIEDFYRRELAAPHSVSSEKDDSSYPHLILICGRYEGIDVRAVRKYADYIFSIGDYVLMGGDLPAQVFIESVLRFVPSVVGRAESVLADSYSGAYLDFPPYGQPVVWNGEEVPPVLRSGDHAAIIRWQKSESLRKTLLTRFDWLRSSRSFLESELAAKSKAIPPHYVIVMHDEVLIGKKEKIEGQTSVTTIDLHDIARSSATYGIKKVFIVTPLIDQQRVTKHFMSFWHSAQGEIYNKDRFDAMSLIEIVSTKAEACAQIAAAHEGREPILIATSAQPYTDVGPEHPRLLEYADQGVAWEHERPVVLCFGTGQGLAPRFFRACAYVLPPVLGFTRYNHLSVRSAVAIILDRWLAALPVERLAVAEVGKRGYTVRTIQRERL